MSVRGIFKRLRSFNTNGKRKAVPDSGDRHRCLKKSRSTLDEPCETYVNNIGEVKNFWEVGNYKYTVKRCFNGYTLGTELATMISERADIEEAYAKSLQQWHKQWTEHLRHKTTEYETGRDSWQAMLNTGNLVADIHMDTHTKLMNEVVPEIKDWLKKSYERKHINFKVTKNFEVVKQNCGQNIEWYEIS